MKNIKEIFNNKRFNFQRFLRNKDETLFNLAGTCYEPASGKSLFFKFTRSFGWEHLSVSLARKCPTWEQMCFMKDQFWNDDEVCYQLHPKKEDYVNNCEYCLHIWKPIDQEIPTPPRIMVGVKDQNDIDTINLMLATGVGVLSYDDCIHDEMFINKI